MALTRIQFVIETEGKVSATHIAEAVGKLFEQTSFAYTKPAEIFAENANDGYLNTYKLKTR